MAYPLEYHSLYHKEFDQISNGTHYGKAAGISHEISIGISNELYHGVEYPMGYAMGRAPRPPMELGKVG